MKKVIDRLTENGQHANEICLLLYLNNNYDTLHYLDFLDITGKSLETLFYKCCFEQKKQCLVETVRYLRSGFLDKETIHKNLNSDHPVYFIDRLLKVGEDWDYVYEDYTAKFHANLRNKSR